MRRRERERLDALCEVRELVQGGTWVVLDVETIGLEQPEIIQWAVAAPDGTILGQGFVQPTRPITEGARAIHGIPASQVAAAPTFAEAWGELFSLLAEKTVVASNASFEREAIHVSAAPYFSFRWGEPRLALVLRDGSLCSGLWGVARLFQQGRARKPLLLSMGMKRRPFDC